MPNWRGRDASTTVERPKFKFKLFKLIVISHPLAERWSLVLSSSTLIPPRAGPLGPRYTRSTGRPKLASAASKCYREKRKAAGLDPRGPAAPVPVFVRTRLRRRIANTFLPETCNVLGEDKGYQCFVVRRKEVLKHCC